MTVFHIANPRRFLRQTRYVFRPGDRLSVAGLVMPVEQVQVGDVVAFLGRVEAVEQDEPQNGED